MHQLFVYTKAAAYQVNRNALKFRYLPDFAAYLLDNKLEDFVLVGIRFAREVDLPMLKPLAKFSEEQLSQMTIESYRVILTALSNGTIADFIDENLRNWIDNKLGVIDRLEIVAEDLTLAFYIRRKLFAHFLYSYSQNTALHQLIIAEVDSYTTQEELVTLKVYLDMQKQVI